MKGCFYLSFFTSIAIGLEVAIQTYILNTIGIKFVLNSADPHSKHNIGIKINTIC